jgi:hypothetical protein
VEAQDHLDPQEAPQDQEVQAVQEVEADKFKINFYEIKITISNATGLQSNFVLSGHELLGSGRVIFN